MISSDSLPRSAVHLGRGLSDSCGHAVPQRRSHNAALMTTRWDHNPTGTLVAKLK